MRNRPIKIWLARTWQSATQWMLEPIDYPFKISPGPRKAQPVTLKHRKLPRHSRSKVHSPLDLQASR